MPLIPNLSLYLIQKFDRLALWGNLTILELHFAETQAKMTSGETARRIKERIKTCEKFILLATDGAIESKWCNWELGFGDAQKYDSKSIALFPFKDKGTYDSSYKGNEYMEIYPHIVYRGGNDKYSSGEKIQDGYYVRYKEKGEYYLTPLEKWLT